MTFKKLAAAVLFFFPLSPVFAAPGLSVVPEGIQPDNNWAWRVDLTPDFVLAPDGTPLAFELGFRLTGAPLLSVTNINPIEFDANNPGNVIFGWETLYGSGFPEGIQANCTGCTVTNAATFGGHAATVVTGTTNEIFTAMGSVNFATPGPKPFLRIVTQGPANGGGPVTNIEWLGAYGGNGRIGRIAQLTPGGPFLSDNFDIYAGTASQMIPEPASGALLAIAVCLVVIWRPHTRFDRAPLARA